MTWGPAMKPLGRQYGCAKISAAVKQKKSGTLRLHIAISQALCKALGNPKRVNVQPGTAADAGKLKLTFSNKGAFVMTTQNRKAMRVMLPMVPEIPADFEFTATECEIVYRDKTELIIALPIKIWTEVAKA